MRALMQFEITCPECGKPRNKFLKKCYECPTGVTVLYRYEDRLYDDYPEVRLRTLPVVRETPHVWFVTADYREKRVYKDSRASYAYPTIELARNSFEIRKRKQLGYLSRQHDHVAAIVKRIEAGTAYEKLEIEDPFADFKFEETT